MSGLPAATKCCTCWRVRPAGPSPAPARVSPGFGEELNIWNLATPKKLYYILNRAVCEPSEHTSCCTRICSTSSAWKSGLIMRWSALLARSKDHPQGYFRDTCALLLTRNPCPLSGTRSGLFHCVPEGTATADPRWSRTGPKSLDESKPWLPWPAPSDKGQWSTPICMDR
jgi:hypothetical protein